MTSHLTSSVAAIILGIIVTLHVVAQPSQAAPRPIRNPQNCQNTDSLAPSLSCTTRALVSIIV